MRPESNLPPMPTRGGDPTQMPDTGDLSALFQSDQTQQQQTNLDDQNRAVMRQFREQLGWIDTIAQQYPMASKSADLAKKALNDMLKEIVKNQPGPSQESPRVPA